MAVDDFKDNTNSKADYPEVLKDELTFDFNDFQVPKVEEKLYSLAQLILNLLLTQPGMYPDMPDLGINIAQYQFEFLDSSTIYNIQRQIRDQIDKYLPNNNIDKIVVLKSEKDNNVLIIGFSIVIDITTGDKQNVFIMVDNESNSYIQFG